MIVSKAKTIMWFVNGNAEKVHPECNLILLNKTVTLPAATHLSTIILTLGYALLRTAFTSHGVGGAVLPMSVHYSRRVSCLAFLETPLIIIERQDMALV
jgi:hypothetical protein